MGQIWFQNQSSEIEVVRSDRFCCPIALTIAVQNLCAMLLSHLFWPLHASTNHNLNVSHSTIFYWVPALFVQQSSFTPVQRIHPQSSFHPQCHKAQIRYVMSQFLDDVCHALHFVVTHACTTFCRTYCAPLQISPKKFEKHAFYIETLRRKNGTDLASKPIN